MKCLTIEAKNGTIIIPVSKITHIVLHKSINSIVIFAGTENIEVPFDSEESKEEAFIEMRRALDEL